MSVVIATDCASQFIQQATEISIHIENEHRDIRASESDFNE
jgi:hypothetical protein